MNFIDLIDVRKMCWPAYLYFFTALIVNLFAIGYYAMYKKTLCSSYKIDDQSVDTCIVECTTFNYFYNLVLILVWTFILNLFCKYGSYIGTGIAAFIYLFSLIPPFYFIKIMMDKTAKQTDLKC
jgi:hypothetical protein